MKKLILVLNGYDESRRIRLLPVKKNVKSNRFDERQKRW